jgi:AcrR family transcriptional regulator
MNHGPATEAGAGDAPKPRRRRRSPEQAQAAILDAAERLFAERGPDRVSVMDVAVEAGVSHSLVLHYFKSYAELVRSVLARRNRTVFQQVKQRLLDPAAQSEPEPDELLGLFLGVVCEPIHARLLSWAALSGEGKNLKMVKNRGLAKVVDLAVARRSARAGQEPHPHAAPPRERIEDAVLVALAAVHGYATGKSIYLPALGHSDEGAMDERFRKALGAMLRSFLSSAE